MWSWLESLYEVELRSSVGERAGQPVPVRRAWYMVRDERCALSADPVVRPPQMGRIRRVIPWEGTWAGPAPELPGCQARSGQPWRVRAPACGGAAGTPLLPLLREPRSATMRRCSVPDRRGGQAAGPPRPVMADFGSVRVRGARLWRQNGYIGLPGWLARRPRRVKSGRVTKAALMHAVRERGRLACGPPQLLGGLFGAFFANRMS